MRPGILYEKMHFLVQNDYFEITPNIPKKEGAKNEAETETNSSYAEILTYVVL